MKEFGFEECPSFPGVSARILRSAQITLNYQDENLVEKEEVFSDFAARVVQHELNHLEGKTIVHYDISKGDFIFDQEKGLDDDLSEKDINYFEYLGKKINTYDEERKKKKASMRFKRGGKSSLI